MPTYTVTLTDAQDKAVHANIESVQLWLQHALDNKARKCKDRIIQAVSKYDPKKLTREEREDIINLVEIEPYSEARQLKDISERITIIVEDKADVGNC